MAAFLQDTDAFSGTGEKNEQGQSLKEFLDKYNPEKYRKPSVTTDALIFSYQKEPVRDTRWKVLLIKRRNHPCIGLWALPGGFAEMGENLDETAARELREETGAEGLPLEQFAVYGEVERDPRDRVITAAYLSAVEESALAVRAGDDAREACWFEISCTSESREQGEEVVTLHTLRLFREEDVLEAKVEERRRTGLVREQHFSVKQSDGIACDHAAIIVQGWKIVESRMICV